TGNTRVVALLHADLHGPGVLQSVSLLADSVISLTGPGEKPKATLIQRKRSGKVTTCTVHCKVRDDFSIEWTNDCERKADESAPVSPSMGASWKDQD
ncbi:hypothetical protein GDO81_028681, partial [Engystomops pustulosus]